MRKIIEFEDLIPWQKEAHRIELRVMEIEENY